MIKKVVLIICIFFYSQLITAQETSEIYEHAIAQIRATQPAFATTQFATGKKTVSFRNQAYAFWLDGEITRFINQQFSNFYGDFLYNPSTLKSFKKAGDKQRSIYQLYVTETVDDLFIIELLSRKRKQSAKYPEFYQGKSTSYLIEKTEQGVRLLHQLQPQNN
ncbi:hypothetical protein [Dokdonia sp. Hel_I_53]|uniref:hypothetical protein n=1 Tax=Dokdonia sp. Hel_I_53 TaxID=1566287 RepID=UPI00119C128A|nr:hypothetical protein [Dokdonia sp. Hel_I_53]TVZ53018.1 hypothetical protein OD90_2209 [Dokdonia sp. Hel_I_53]